MRNWAGVQTDLNFGINHLDFEINHLAFLGISWDDELLLRVVQTAFPTIQQFYAAFVSSPREYPSEPVKAVIPARNQAHPLPNILLYMATKHCDYIASHLRLAYEKILDFDPATQAQPPRLAARNHLGHCCLARAHGSL